MNPLPSYKDLPSNARGTIITLLITMAFVYVGIYLFVPSIIRQEPFQIPILISFCFSAVIQSLSIFLAANWKDCPPDPSLDNIAAAFIAMGTIGPINILRSFVPFHYGWGIVIWVGLYGLIFLVVIYSNHRNNYRRTKHE